MVNKNKKINTVSCLWTWTRILVPLFMLILIVQPAEAANNILIGQEEKIIELTNKIRQQSGASILMPDDRLMISASNKARDMAERSYFSHATPEGSRMAYWIKGTGYYYSLAGENLAKGFNSIDRLVQAWVDSSSHYNNLTEPRFKNIGVGIAERFLGDKKIIFVVQHFGVERQLIINSNILAVNISPWPRSAIAGRQVEAINPQSITSFNLTNASLVMADFDVEAVSSERDDPSNWIKALLAIISLGFIGYFINYINTEQIRKKLFMRAVLR